MFLANWLAAVSTTNCKVKRLGNKRGLIEVTNIRISRRKPIAHLWFQSKGPVIWGQQSISPRRRICLNIWRIIYFIAEINRLIQSQERKRNEGIYCTEELQTGIWFLAKPHQWKNDISKLTDLKIILKFELM